MFRPTYVYSSIYFMRFPKTLIVVTSWLGVYKTVRRYQKKKRPVRPRRRLINTQQTNKYLHLTADQVREEFKNRIAAGDWLNQEEYTQMMNAMKNKR